MTENDLPLNAKAQAIAADVRRRIVEREWRQGDRIPDEAELALSFGVARATVNKALQLLADEGLLDRKRRAGTHVAMNPARKATLSIPIVREQVEQAGMRYSHKVVSRKTAPLPDDLALRMDLAAGSPLIRLRTVHFGDGAPFQLEDRWINPVAVPGAEDVDFSVFNANEWLVHNFPWARADMRFGAENANAADARLMGTKKGAALLVLERTTWNEVAAITFAKLAFRPGSSIAAMY